MSGYEKIPQTQPTDYENRVRTSQAQITSGSASNSGDIYNTYSAPQYSAQTSTESSVPATSSAPSPATGFPTRTFEENSLIQEPQPQVQGFYPREGGEGTMVSVTVQYPPSLGQNLPSHALTFGYSTPCSTSIQTKNTKEGAIQLTAQAPSYSKCGYTTSTQVPVFLNVERPNSNSSQLEIGSFAYMDTNNQSFPSTSPSMQNRKRKASHDEQDPRSPPAKRPTSQPIRSKSESFYYPQPPMAPPPLTPNGYSYGPSNNDRGYMYNNGYDSRQTSSAAQSPSTSAYLYPETAGSSSTVLTPTQPQVSPWSSEFPSSLSMSMGASTITARSPISGPSGVYQSSQHSHQHLPPLQVAHAENMPTPSLIRTSTLQSAVHPNGSRPGGYNPYNGIYPQKASIQLRGDLDSIGESYTWTEEEWDNRRRLVEFHRQQRGSEIIADFQTVSPTERSTSSICISCIYWREKNAAYVTSVDCIYLLESLIGEKFTVEEKNRIRRNLEGFKPMTVSKGKPDSESFFKVIMNFSEPKPRNIEKDVKVFPWKILKDALKKIVGKYSADYSSTSSIITQPSVSHHSSDHYSHPPPPPPPPSHISQMDRRHITTSPLDIKPQMPIPVTISMAGPLSGLPTLSPITGDHKQRPHQQYTTTDHYSMSSVSPHAPEHGQVQPMWQSQPLQGGPSPQIGSRGSWDNIGYVDSGSNALSAINQPLQYSPRSPVHNRSMLHNNRSSGRDGRS